MSTERNQKKNKEDMINSDASVVEKLSFDLYFQLLMSQDKKIQAHHKAPMKKFAETQLTSTEATVEDFEKIFKNY